MDAALTPPLRLQPQRAQQISAEAVQKRLDGFIHRLRERNLLKNVGETTTAVQLQKLADALTEESGSRD